MTKIARFVLGARDESPIIVPRKESGSSCGHSKHVMISEENTHKVSKYLYTVICMYTLGEYT